jgi:hypothetical protein
MKYRRIIVNRRRQLELVEEDLPYLISAPCRFDQRLAS